MTILENIINRIVYPDFSEQSFSASILAAVTGIFSLALSAVVIREQNFSFFFIKLFFLITIFLFLTTIYLPATSIYWLKASLNYQQILVYLNWRLATLALTLPIAIICRFIRWQLFYSLLTGGIFLLLFSKIVKDISLLTEKKPAVIIISFFLPLFVMFCIASALLFLSLLIIRLSS